MLLLAAFVMSPAVAAASAKTEAVTVNASAGEQTLPPTSQAEGVKGQLAAAEDCNGCGLEAAVAVDRPTRVGKAQFSPIGEAVLNLLRSQGGGHLRP